MSATDDFNNVLKKCQNNTNEYASVFSKGEARDIIRKSLVHVNLSNEESNLWLEFLLKALLLDCGIRNCLEKEKDIRIQIEQVQLFNAHGQELHTTLLKFLFHYYGSLYSTDPTGIPFIEDKSYVIDESHQALLPLSASLFPQKPSGSQALLSQRTLLWKLKTLQKQVLDIEETHNQLAQINLDLQKRLAEVHFKNEDICKKNGLMHQEIENLDKFVKETAESNIFLRNRCDLLSSSASSEELHETSRKIHSLSRVACPSFCSTDQSGTISGFVGKRTSFNIIARCRDGQKLCQGGEIFHASAEGPGPIAINIHDNQDGTYTISCVPKHQGSYKISLTLRGRHIQNSPLMTDIWRSYSEITTPRTSVGAKGSGAQQFSLPYGISVDYLQRNLVVADTDNHRIQILDQNGRFLRTFGSHGTQPGKLNYPYDVAVDKAGNILVADWGNNIIQVFDRNGVFISHFGGRGTKEGLFEHPRGIHVDKKKNIYVTDEVSVQVFGPDYKFVARFEGVHNAESNLLSKFWMPAGVVSDSKGHIIVADTGNSRIVVLDQDTGDCIHIIGGTDVKERSLQEPWGLVVDPVDHIIVTDRKTNKVQVYDSEGVFVNEFGSNSNNARISSPIGIAVNCCGDLFVVENQNSRIQIY